MDFKKNRMESMNEIIRQKILSSESGSISYSEYIQAVLYDLSEGYYMKPGTKVGKAGDFYTSSHVHAVFAKVFAKVFIDLIEKHRLPSAVCEIGGGSGRFANSVLNEWQRLSPQTFDQLDYFMIEGSPFHRQLQRQQVPLREKAIVYSSVEEMRKDYEFFEGIVFSNELFDSFPVDVVQKEDGRLHEARVTLNHEDMLAEKLEPIRPELMEWLEKHQINLVEGQRIEVALFLDNWLQQMSDWLKAGFVITVDYGYTREEWQSPEHKNGSLRGYYQHEMIDNILLYPGKMDITSHIHLDLVKEIGEEKGLSFVGTLRQDHFLLKVGILEYLKEHYDPNPFSEISKQNRAVRSFIIDGGISSAFHVIMQQKGYHSLSLDEIL
jgi:SAM-dependent MidA family methyltransferase